MIILKTKILAVSVCAALIALMTSARAFEPADVLRLVNEEARLWIIGGQDLRLEISSLHIPRSPKETGFVCGAIKPTSAAYSGLAFEAYRASLWIENGQLVVGNLSPYFMPETALMKEEECQRPR